MNANWILLGVLDKQIEAEIWIGKLDAAGISAIIVPKKDSSFNNFGNYQIFVPQYEIEKVLTIWNDATDNRQTE